jgi:hypothetical protein
MRNLVSVAIGATLSLIVVSMGWFAGNVSFSAGVTFAAWFVVVIFALTP